jgi:hypothetical protein
MIPVDEISKILKEWSECLSAAGGFIAGLLAVAAKIRIGKADIVRRVKMWRLSRKLAKAEEHDVPERAQELQFTLQVMKLYSPNETDQGTALAYLIQIADARTVDILADRLGSDPPLTGAIKIMLVTGMRGLMRDHNA